MTSDQVTKRLKMVRWNLERLPAFPLPAGFEIKWYEPGDERCWYEIHLRADRRNSITPELFGRQFGADAAVLKSRQCYLVARPGGIVGTATAWFQADEKNFGRVHWVALDPGYQGQGLSRPLVSVVCERLKWLGHDKAFLSTSAERIPAIRTYRRFGFEPWIESEREAELWRGVERALKA